MADVQGVVGMDSAPDSSPGHSAGPFLKIYLWPSPLPHPLALRTGKGPLKGPTLHTRVGCTLFACAKADEGASWCDQWPSRL